MAQAYKDSPEVLSAPKGTLKILKTKQSLGLHTHEFESGFYEFETLHRSSLGDKYRLDWFYDAFSRTTTLRWREKTEKERQGDFIMSRIDALRASKQDKADAYAYGINSFIKQGTKDGN